MAGGALDLRGRAPAPDRQRPPRSCAGSPGSLLALEHEEPDVERPDRRPAAPRRHRSCGRVPPAIRHRGSVTRPYGDGRVYLDHARDIGAYNPCFPEYDIAVDGDRAHGTVTFPVPYEGPPGIVHGGFLAVFFDCVVQHHNCDVGVAGKTTSLVAALPASGAAADRAVLHAGADRRRGTDPYSRVDAALGRRACCARPRSTPSRETARPARGLAAAETHRDVGRDRGR